jgi:hypothetical protein
VEAERVEEERVRGVEAERAEGVDDDSHALLSQLLLLMTRCEEEEEAEEAGRNGARLVAAAVAAEEARREERAAAETSREHIPSLTSTVVHGKRLRQDLDDEPDAGNCSAQCRRAPRVSGGCVSGNGGGADAYEEAQAGGADVSYKCEGKTREGSVAAERETRAGAGMEEEGGGQVSAGLARGGTLDAVLPLVQRKLRSLSPSSQASATAAIQHAVCSAVEQFAVKRARIVSRAEAEEEAAICSIRAGMERELQGLDVLHTELLHDAVLAVVERVGGGLGAVEVAQATRDNC